MYPLLLVVLVAVGVAWCGGSGIEQYGGFTFVSPGGQTELTYPAGQRGLVGDLFGPDLPVNAPSPWPTTRTGWSC